MSVSITRVVLQAKSEGVTQATSELQNLTQAAKDTSSAINKVRTSSNSLKTAMESLSTSTGGLTRAYEAGLVAGQRNLELMRQQAAVMQSLSNGARSATGGTEALAAAMALLAGSLNIINLRLQEQANNQRRATNEMREAQAVARGLSGSLGALWLTYGNFAGMAVGLAIGASLKGIITVGKDVEATLEGIRVRGNETVESIKMLREVVLDLGTGVYGPQQVAKALETLVLAGLNATQAASSIGAALNLATVGGTSIEKAATTLVSVGTAIGFAAEGFGRVGDVIAKTAALSMSSVETLSEAFKSASSVNRLYGVSLEDIGTSLGVLSNLGIQGSAAGTSLKNFYKELASESDKVTKTLKDLGLTQASFKNADGNFKPLIEVVGILDGGLKKLSESQQKIAQSNLSNERGQRLMTQVLGEYNTKLDDGSNALEKFRKNVENSYGFAAKGAAQMALTAKSQIDSMFNTLKSAFAETFKSIEPQLIGFSLRLKQTFATKEFKENLVSLAEAFAKLAVGIAENLPLIANLIGGFVALKLAMAGGAMWTMAVEGIAKLRVALVALQAGTLTLTASLGPLGIVLGVVAAAWVAYNLAKGDDPSKQSKNASDYSKGYIDGLIKESENLDKVNAKLREKKSLSEINAEMERDASRERMQQLDQAAIREAELNLQKTKGNFNQAATFAAMKELDAVRVRAANNAQLAAAAEATLFARAKENAELAKAAADAKRKQDQDEPTATLSVKPDRAAANDEYAAALEKINSNIKASKKALQQFEEENNAKFKAGEIGRLEFIESVGAREIEEYQIRAKEIQDKIDIASRGKNKKADVARFTGALDSVNTDLENAKVKQASQTSVELARIADENAKYQIAKLESQGKYVEAASKRWESSYSAAFKSAKADFDKFGDKIPEVADRMQQFIELQEQMTNKAQMKEAVAAYDNLYASIANGIKGVQTASEKDGIGAMWEAAQEASEKYKASLPALAQALQAVKDASAVPGASQEDAAKYEEELARQTSLAEKYKTMWTGVGASISKSLGDAFGNAGKATGSIITAMTKYSLDEKKSSESRIKLYGDLAGAAKGYFKEGSTGYKLLEGAEQAFRIVEMANQAKSLVMSLFVSETKAAGAVAGQVVETGAVVAGEAARNTAKVPGVFMSFMSALGPWGAAAAAVAIAAVLGGAFSGGGGGGVSSEERQRTQGTGSILGDKDAKSESITRALEAIQKDSGLGLVNSNQMVISLKQIVNGIGGLSSLLVRSTDLTSTGSYESLGGVEKFANSAGIFSLGEKLTGGIMGKVLGGIFGGKTTVEDSGISIASSTLENIQKDGVSSNKFVDTKKKGGLFSSDKYKTQTDTLGAEANEQFGMIINGLADTVMSAAKTLGIGGSEFNKRLSTFVVDLGKISLKDKTGEEIQSILESVFSKLGDDMAKFGVQGLKDYQKVGEGYLETLARVTNDYMQVSDVLAVLGKSFNTVGLGAVYLSENLIEAAGDLETLTSGTKFFVDNFLSEAERMGPITNSINKELTRLGLSTNITSEQFKQLVLQQDLNTIAGQEMYVALLNIAPAFKEAADYAADLANGTVKLSDAQQRALDKIDKARSALDDAYNAQAEGLTSSIDKLKAFAESLKSFQSSLLTGASSPLTAAQKYAQTLANFTTVSAAAKAGDATAQAGFQQAANELLAASKGYNASSQAYTDDFNKVLKVTSELAAATSGKLTDAQAQLDALNKQVEGLLTVNQSVLSVAEAINNLQSAILSGRAQGLTDAQMGVVKVDGSHASGLSYVPKDGYIAELHKGERVLTAKEANSYNSSNSSSDNSELVSEVRDMKEQLAKALSDLAAATVNSNFGAANSAADKTVAALDETMTKVANKCNTIKMN